MRSNLAISFALSILVAAPALGADRPAPFGPELGGVKLGMTLEEVRRAIAAKLEVEPTALGATKGYLEAANRLYQDSSCQGDVWKKPNAERPAVCRTVMGPRYEPTGNPNEYVRFVRLEKTGPEGTNELTAWFTREPGKERVATLRRLQSFSTPAVRPTLAATMGALEERLGKPLLCDHFTRAEAAQAYQLLFQTPGCTFQPAGLRPAKLPPAMHPMIAVGTCKERLGNLTRNGPGATQPFRVTSGYKAGTPFSVEVLEAWKQAREKSVERPLSEVCGEALYWAEDVSDDPAVGANPVGQLVVHAVWIAEVEASEARVKALFKAAQEADLRRRAEAGRKVIEANKKKPDL